MKVSIITVCLNSENTIERTFKSVISQTYSEFEYIVVDGESKDNTVKIVKEYCLKFKDKNISFKWVSEKDKGLYDVMNKGAKMALGEYLIYMNADDEFADKNCLETAVRYMDSKIDVLYGNANIINGNEKERRKSQEINSIKKHLPFIPQSAFIRTVIQKKYLFNLDYKISADFDSFLRMYLDGCIFKQIDYTFSNFYAGGVSWKNSWKTYKEDIRVKHENKILNRCAPFQIVKYIYRYFVYKFKKI